MDDDRGYPYFKGNLHIDIISSLCDHATLGEKKTYVEAQPSPYMVVS